MSSILFYDAFFLTNWDYIISAYKEELHGSSGSKRASTDSSVRPVAELGHPLFPTAFTASRIAGARLRLPALGRMLLRRFSRRQRRRCHGVTECCCFWTFSSSGFGRRRHFILTATRSDTAFAKFGALVPPARPGW